MSPRRKLTLPDENGANSRSRGRTTVLQPEFRQDLRFRVETDCKVALRLLDLIEAVVHDPYDGIGKPELLRYLGSNVWARRLTQEHRVVYVVRAERIYFLQARFLYEE